MREKKKRKSIEKRRQQNNNRMANERKYQIGISNKANVNNKDKKQQQQIYLFSRRRVHF